MPVWGLVLAFFAAAVWALSPLFMKEGLKAGCGPSEVNPIRAIGYILTMTVMMLVLQPGKWPELTFLLITGLFVNVGTSAVIGDQMYIHSIDKIGASLAVSVSSGYPLVTTICSIFMLGEEVGLLVWGSTILIICGILVIRYDATKREDKTPEYDVNFKQTRAEKLKGILLALGAAVLWGANIPFLKYMMNVGGWNGVESYFLRSLVFFVLVWGARLIQVRKFPGSIVPLQTLPLRAWGALMCAGVLSVALGGIAFAMCIQVLPVSVVTPITASSPFMTVLISRIIFKEKLSRLQGGGVALVIAGSIGVSL